MASTPAHYRLQPVAEVRHGRIATQAFRLCRCCGATIDSVSGPGTRPICQDCGDKILSGQYVLVPKVPSPDMIDPNDLKVEVVQPHPPGGQHVGWTVQPIKVTHIPTGIEAAVCMRSQHHSKRLAIEMIEAALTSPRFRP